MFAVFAWTTTTARQNKQIKEQQQKTKAKQAKQKTW